jgi:hypothetical protein
MKSKIKYLFFGLLFLSGAIKPVAAQNSPPIDIKNTLVRLLDYSKSKSYSKAALLIAYNGEDKSRFQKDSFNPVNKDELTEAKRFCKKISALIELSSKYEITTFTPPVSGSKDAVFTLNVVFISGEQKLTTSFSFIKCEKGYLLTNMN